MEWDNLVSTLNIIGEASKTEYKSKLKAGAYATGKLFNSVNYRVDVSETGIKLSFSGLEPYYINVENGRKAGSKFPPIAAIQKWMISKNLPDKPGAAFLITRKIAEKGIKPKPYIRDIKIKLKENYSDDINRAFKLDMEEFLNNKIKEINNDNNNK
jgi:hypothetical protein